MRVELGRGHDHRLQAKRRKLVLHVGRCTLERGAK
jgi:hypothetical protein